MKGRGGLLTTVVLMVVILLGFAGSSTWAQPAQWVDINQTVFNLNSIFMLSPTVGWAVGDAGTILHWNGVEWTLVQAPTPLNLYSVSFPDASNPNDGWIVGQFDVVTGFPAILHWDGIAWVQLDITNGISWAAGAVGDLWSLSFLSPSDGWAVGAPGVVTNIVHWSGRWAAGGSWTTKATPDLVSTFYSVQVLSNTATPVGGYAVGGVVAAAGAILYWDGANWNNYIGAGALPAAALRSISMISSTDAWAVGDAVGANPTAIRLSGTTWGGPMSLSALGIRNLYSVVALDANSALAVGTLGFVGATDIIRFTTPAWTTVSSPATVDLFSICKVAAGSPDLWAVGFGGTILRYSAGTWRVLTSPVGAGNLVVPPPIPPPDLWSVHFTSPTDGWAVGQIGSIIKYDGTTWGTYQTAPIVPNDLHSVYTISPTDGWAVGQNGAILRLTASGWGVVAQCPGPTCLQNVRLRSVFELSTGEAWAVGDSPGAGQPATIIHWVPPGPWSQVPSNTPVGFNLNSVFILADGSEGWAVGTNLAGTLTIIDHWKSGVWTVITYNPPIPGNLALDSVVVVGNNPSNVWATGTSSVIGGIVLHYDGTIWAPVPVNQLGLTGWTAIGFVPGSTSDAWIVGGNIGGGGGQTLHWDGTAWTDIPLAPRPFVFPAFRSVQMLGADDGWAVGGLGHIIRLSPRPPSTVTLTTSVSTTVTQTTSTSSTTITSSTVPPGPGIPGFPIESILAGLVAGAASLAIVRRRRMRLS